MNKQQLANKIWESANKMRSKIEANEYKDYILGFIFYKFLSDREEKYLRSEGWDNEYMQIYLREEYDSDLFDEDYSEKDHRDFIVTTQKSLGYFMSYDHLFSTWLSKGSDFNVSDVRDALSAFSRLINSTHKKVFEGVFDTLQTGLSKLGDSSNSQTRAISDLIHLIKDIPMDGKQDYDVLGFIYEYLISNFAANAGKKAGEFYTPHEVSLLMSEIVANHLKDRVAIKIYDPTSGSGSLLINIGKSIARYMGNSDMIKYYAQELKENTYNLTRMNLVMRGILPDNIVTRNADTLEDDWPYFDDQDPKGTYEPLYVDAVVSNPPYSQNWNPTDKENDPRYSRYGVAPKSKADYAFLLHDLYHILPNGIMTIVLPHGVLFRGGEEGAIRKNLIENNNIDAIIGLPANIFFGTGIPTIIMVLRQKRDNTDVLIIDASKGYEKAGKNNKLRASDIKRIVDAVTQRANIDKFSRVVSRELIRQNDYNLNIPRYVDSSEKAENWDIYASMFGGIPVSELEDYHTFWDAFPNLKNSLFTPVNDNYVSLNCENLKETVLRHPDVQAFIDTYVAAFSDFPEHLNQELLQDTDKVNVAKEEAVLSADIFERLHRIPLVDAYEAYQILDDKWNSISVDLEIIQTEGFKATKQVDPNMVVKKKNNKDVEVQDGYIGHVLPFELVQSALLCDELTALRNDEDRLSQISSSYEEQLDTLSEEDKGKDYVNEDKTAFVWVEVKKAVKQKSDEPDVIAVLKEALSLNEEEKKLKKKIKDGSAILHQKTKDTIEALSDDAVHELLYKKWITPLTDAILRLPQKIITYFAASLERTASKYEATLSEVETEIRETESELSAMLDMLTGGEFDMAGLREFQKMLGGE